jgi:hypothetical protein
VNAVLHLEITGILLVVLAAIHVVFPKKFHWSRELPKLDLINRQIFVVHTFFIAATVALMGLLCVSSAEELVQTAFGRRIAGALAVFWFLRLLAQLFYYSPELWRGRRFESAVHVVFTIFWIYLVALFAWVGFGAASF